MAISIDLRVLAQKLENNSNNIIAYAASKNPETLDKVSSAIAAASTLLTSVADDFDNNASDIDIKPEQLDIIAALATELSKSKDPKIQKQASVLDELLLSIAAPKNAIAQAKKVREDELNRLRDKRREEKVETLYVEPKKALHKSFNHDEMAKAVDEQVKTYRPLEAPLQTRYSPDMPGTPMVRITDHVYQDINTGKIYDYEAGYTTSKGNKIPGSSVANQSQLNDNRQQNSSMFETRDSLMGRYAATSQEITKTAAATKQQNIDALRIIRDMAPELLNSAIDFAGQQGMGTSDIADALSEDIENAKDAGEFASYIEDVSNVGDPAYDSYRQFGRKKKPGTQEQYDIAKRYLETLKSTGSQQWINFAMESLDLMYDLNDQQKGKLFTEVFGSSMFDAPKKDVGLQLVKETLKPVDRSTDPMVMPSNMPKFEDEEGVETVDPDVDEDLELVRSAFKQPINDLVSLAEKVDPKKWVEVFNMISPAFVAEYNSKKKDLTSESDQYQLVQDIKSKLTDAMKAAGMPGPWETTADGQKWYQYINPASFEIYNQFKPENEPATTKEEEKAKEIQKKKYEDLNLPPVEIVSDPSKPKGIIPKEKKHPAYKPISDKPIPGELTEQYVRNIDITQNQAKDPHAKIELLHALVDKVVERPELLSPNMVGSDQIWDKLINSDIANLHVLLADRLKKSQAFIRLFKNEKGYKEHIIKQLAKVQMKTEQESVERVKLPEGIVTDKTKVTTDLMPQGDMRKLIQYIPEDPKSEAGPTSYKSVYLATKEKLMAPHGKKRLTAAEYNKFRDDMNKEMESQGYFGPFRISPNPKTRMYGPAINKRVRGERFASKAYDPYEEVKYIAGFRTPNARPVEYLAEFEKAQKEANEYIKEQLAAVPQEEQDNLLKAEIAAESIELVKRKMAECEWKFVDPYSIDPQTGKQWIEVAIQKVQHIEENKEGLLEGEIKTKDTDGLLEQIRKSELEESKKPRKYINPELFVHSVEYNDWLRLYNQVKSEGVRLGWSKPETNIYMSRLFEEHNPPWPSPNDPSPTPGVTWLKYISDILDKGSKVLKTPYDDSRKYSSYLRNFTESVPDDLLKAYREELARNEKHDLNDEPLETRWKDKLRKFISEAMFKAGFVSPFDIDPESKQLWNEVLKELLTKE